MATRHPPTRPTPPQAQPAGFARTPAGPALMTSEQERQAAKGSFLGTIYGKDIAESGSYFVPGLYEVEVYYAKLKREGFHGDAYIVRFIVHKSSDSRISVGSMCDWVAKAKHPSTKANIARFLAATLMTPLKEIAPSHTLESIGTAAQGYLDTPLKGLRVQLQVTLTNTSAGGEFHKHTFFALGQAAPTVAQDEAADEAADEAGDEQED